jgi:hypothetical protein
MTVARPGVLDAVEEEEVISALEERVGLDLLLVMTRLAGVLLLLLPEAPSIAAVAAAAAAAAFAFSRSVVALVLCLTVLLRYKPSGSLALAIFLCCCIVLFLLLELELEVALLTLLFLLLLETTYGPSVSSSSSVLSISRHGETSRLRALRRRVLPPLLALPLLAVNALVGSRCERLTSR